MSKSTYRKKAVMMCLDKEFKDKGWFYPDQLHDRINMGMKKGIQYLPNTHSFITVRSCANHCKILYARGILNRRHCSKRKMFIYRYGLPAEEIDWRPI